MKQVATTPSGAAQYRQRARDRERGRRSFDVRVPEDSVALILTKREALAFRRFCNSYHRGEFRDSKEFAAFRRAVDKLYDVTALWPFGEDAG